MSQPVESPPPTQAAPAVPAGPSAAAPPQAPGRERLKTRRRHARVMVRKVSPWSVFKVSLIFYACLMLVVLGAFLILYAMLGAIGAISSLEQLANNLGFGPGFRVHGGWLLARGFGIGITMVVVWSLINVFVAFLYNLISDLVGGIEITLAERR